MRPVSIVALLSLAPYAIAKDFHLFTRHKVVGKMPARCPSLIGCLCPPTPIETWTIGAVAGDDYYSDSAYLDDANFPVTVPADFPLSSWVQQEHAFPKLCGSTNVQIREFEDKQRMEIGNSINERLLAKCFVQRTLPNDFDKVDTNKHCPDQAHLTDVWVCVDSTPGKLCP